jgi:hypothetical protein
MRDALVRVHSLTYFKLIINTFATRAALDLVVRRHGPWLGHVPEPAGFAEP